MFHEVYVKPTVRYRGSHNLGKAEDQKGKPARTVLSLMLKPLFTSASFVVRLIPVFSLTGEFLFEQIKSLILIVHDCGGSVISLVCDNASTKTKTVISCSMPIKVYLGLGVFRKFQTMNFSFYTIAYIYSNVCATTGYQKETDDSHSPWCIHQECSTTNNETTLVISFCFHSPKLMQQT